MAKWLRVVKTNCADATREAEFNEWYDNTHLPDVMETAGFIRATRYVKAEPSEGEAKYLALYEIETDDIDAMMKANRENMDRKRAEGRFSDLLVSVSRDNYRQISSLSK